MKLQLFKYTCGRCGHSFEAPELPGNQYGLFLMRSEGKDTLALVNALDDTVFEEVDRLLSAIPGIEAKSDAERAMVLHAIFGICYDPDEDGSLFGIGTFPACSECSSREIAYWQASDPPIFVELSLPSVTHDKWKSLNTKSRLNLLREEMTRKGLG